MAAVAEALEMDGPVDAAAEAWRRLVAAAEGVGEVEAQNALREQSEFAMNNPEYATEGIRALTRLLGPGQLPDDAPSLRLDLADLYETAGEPARAEALYEDVLASNPADPWVHLRCARWLAEHGRRAEAEATYRTLIDRNGLGDRAALLDAKREVGELS